MATDPSAPKRLHSPPFDPSFAGSGGEVDALERLHTAGVRLAPIALVPAAAEERFYRLNNLAERIAALFAGVALDDPDEDDIEEIAPGAQALMRSHYLLDETIDELYRAVGGLGTRLRVRRPDDAGAVALSGRPALLEVKRLWRESWAVERVMARLVAGEGLAADATPVLLHADDRQLPPGPGRDAVASVLGHGVRAYGLPNGDVTRVERLR